MYHLTWIQTHNRVCFLLFSKFKIWASFFPTVYWKHSLGWTVFVNWVYIHIWYLFSVAKQIDMFSTFHYRWKAYGEGRECLVKYRRIWVISRICQQIEKDVIEKQYSDILHSRCVVTNNFLLVISLNYANMGLSGWKACQI